MELMVVLAIAATIIAIGAPNFNAFRLNGRLTNTANDVLASLVTARTDAIKAQVNVSMCASANPGATDATCADGSTVGWIAFRDPDGDCTRATSEPIVSSGVFDHSFNSQPMHINKNGNCVSFSPTGFTRTVSGVTMLDHLLLCDGRGIAPIAGSNSLSAGRGLVIDRTGRSRITRTISGGLADDLNTWDATAGVELSCP